MDEFSNDDIWDESQWEKHISDVERKSKQLRKFIEPGKYEHLPSWISIIEEFTNEYDIVDEFVDRELELEEAYYPDDDELDAEEDDLDDDLFLSHDAFDPDSEEDLDALFEELDRFTDGDEYEEGDEWKALTDDYDGEPASIMKLGIYNDARNLAALCIQEIEPTMVANYPIQYIKFVDEVMHIASKIASGYSFGFESEMIGGNLVCNKKALEHANNALAQLQKQKKQPYIVNEVYVEFHRLLFELRNDIALYVLDLRSRFNTKF